MKRITCLAAIMSLLLFAMPYFAVGGEGYIGDYLSIEQVTAVADSIKVGQKEIKDLKAAGKITSKEAAEINGAINDLINDQYKFGGCIKEGVYGCVKTMFRIIGVPIHVTQNFFDLTAKAENIKTENQHFQKEIADLKIAIEKMEQGTAKKKEKERMERFQAALAKQPSAKDADEQLRLARLEQFSVLLHEWKHKQYKGVFEGGPGEKEAFAFQHKWMQLFGTDQNSALADTVKKQLVALGASPAPPSAATVALKGSQEFERCIEGPLKTYNDFVDWSKKVRDKDYWSLFRCGPVGANWQEYPEKICCDTYVPKEDWNGLQDCGWKYKLEKEKAVLDKKIAECKKQYPGQ